MTNGLPVSGAGWAGSEAGNKAKSKRKSLHFIDGLLGQQFSHTPMMMMVKKQRFKEHAIGEQPETSSP
jgi:hypothetical protein